MITLEALEERSAHPTQKAAIGVADKLLELGFSTRVRKAPEGAPRDRGWIMEAWTDAEQEQFDLLGLDGEAGDAAQS